LFLEAVSILAFLKKKNQPDQVILVKQFRPPVGKYSIENPAGIQSYTHYHTLSSVEFNDFLDLFLDRYVGNREDQVLLMVTNLQNMQQFVN
jgi:hypothetical protein